MNRRCRSPYTRAGNGENSYYCFLTRSPSQSSIVPMSRLNWNRPMSAYFDDNNIPAQRSDVDLDYPFEVSKVDEIADNYKGVVITSFGIICVYLEHKIRVDISLDRSVRLINPISMCSSAMDSTGFASCLVHYSGRVYQTDTAVAIQLQNGHKAKMCNRGITFGAKESPIVYLLDEGGVKTTMDTFAHLEPDLSVHVFYSNSQYGQSLVGECFQVLQNAKSYVHRNGDNVWMINGIEITQSTQGDVCVSRDNGRRYLKTSVLRVNATVCTPLLYACASMPPDSHLFVRRGEKRIFAKDNECSVRNGLRSASLDEMGLIKLY